MDDCNDIQLNAHLSYFAQLDAHKLKSRLWNATRRSLPPPGIAHAWSEKENRWPILPLLCSLLRHFNLSLKTRIGCIWIHSWWPLPHGLHFWCPTSTWRDPLLVALIIRADLFLPLSIIRMRVILFHPRHIHGWHIPTTALLVPHLYATGSTSGGSSSWAALLVPHLYVTGSTSGGSFIMGCTSVAPSIRDGIHFWWPVHHGMHFWCPISTWRDPLLVARSSWAVLRGPSFMGFAYREPILMGSASRGPILVGSTYRGPIFVRPTSRGPMFHPKLRFILFLFILFLCHLISHSLNVYIPAIRQFSVLYRSVEVYLQPKCISSWTRIHASFYHVVKCFHLIPLQNATWISPDFS